MDNQQHSTVQEEIIALREDIRNFRKDNQELSAKVERVLIAVTGTPDQPHVGLLRRMDKMEEKDIEQDDRLLKTELSIKSLWELTESDKSQDKKITDLEKWKAEQKTIENAHKAHQDRMKGWREWAMWGVRIAISLGTLAIGVKLWVTAV